MQPFDELSLPHTVATIDAQRAVWMAGPSCIRHEVVGEVYNPEQMQRVVAAVQGRTDAVIQAWLLPEPQNPHDPGAIVVWVLGGKVGYLPRELAFQWRPIFARFFERYGAPVACQAQIEPPSHANQGSFGVVVWLPALPASSPTPSQRIASAAPLLAAQPAAVAVAPAPNATLPDVERVRAELGAAQEALRAATRDADELERIRADIVRARAELKVVERELRSVEEALDIQSFGFYTPKYGFESSAQYTARLKGIRDEQQALIKEDKAAPCDTKWSVGGSAAEGKKMIRQQAKLMLRAFNGECDAAIVKVRYDNVVTLEQRLTKAYNDINKLGEVQRVFISRRYFDLRLAELHLVHEHREKVQQEKEEQKRIKEQMREEQKALEEIERAQAEAEKEETKSAAALDRARAELAAADAAAAAEAAKMEAAGQEASIAEAARAATAKQHERLEALVNRLETDLKDAIDRKAKAIARAQLTKSGHVYVLSNIGSFGEGVYKIGMTRRLEPLERVDELGDASVPFPFDVHAIIYSEDAPGLENRLHRAFADRRVNVVNQRKEYFRVTLDEVRDAVHKLHGLVTFLLVPEAEEYRKTQAAIGAPKQALALGAAAEAEPPAPSAD